MKLDVDLVFLNQFNQKGWKCTGVERISNTLKN